LHRPRAGCSLPSGRARPHSPPLRRRLGRQRDAGGYGASTHLGGGRRALLSPVCSNPARLAPFAGGPAAGVVGLLVEDSGPVLLVVAVFTLGCVLAYLWGKPRAALDGVRPEELARAPGRYSSSPGIGSIGSSS